MTFQRQTQEVFTNQGRAMNWKNTRIFATNKWGYLANIEILMKITKFTPACSNLLHQVNMPPPPPIGSSASYVWIGANDLDTPDTWIWDNNTDQFWLGKVFGNPIGGLYNN
jgi:hypothetical protein